MPVSRNDNCPFDSYQAADMHCAQVVIFPHQWVYITFGQTVAVSIVHCVTYKSIYAVCVMLPYMLVSTFLCAYEKLIYRWTLVHSYKYERRGVLKLINSSLSGHNCHCMFEDFEWSRLKREGPGCHCFQSLVPWSPTLRLTFWVVYKLKKSDSLLFVNLTWINNSSI